MGLSDSSKAKLINCHPDLVRVIEKVAETWDLVVATGYRGKEEQDVAVASGLSQTPFPTSKHNQEPSLAVDVVPLDMTVSGRIDWNDVKRDCYLAGFIMATAQSMGVNMRWGGDWNKDTNLKDNKFNDIDHFELI